MLRPEKVQRVAEITERFRAARSIFVADYTGLKVVDITELRRRLREQGVTFRVEKNTLLRRAAVEAGLEELIPQFEGPTAVAFALDDPTVPARILQEFYARLEKPKVRAFRVEGRMYGPGDVRPLAELPPREVLLSMVVAAVESPISALVGTLNAILRECVATVEAIAEKKQAGAGADGEETKE